MANSKKYVDKTVMYFDDQLEKTKAVTDFLRHALGLKVALAETPDKAFSLLTANRFDLVILDIRHVNAEHTRDGKKCDWENYGYYFLQELREGRIIGETPSDVPVLFITCIQSTPTVEQLSRLGNSHGGSCAYLYKPVPCLATVEEAIEALLMPQQ